MTDIKSRIVNREDYNIRKLSNEEHEYRGRVQLFLNTTYVNYKILNPK